MVGYVRVSTEEQERSGLGVEAQREAILSEADRRGAAAHPDDGADDAAFANDARALANEVRAILRRAERQHGADDHDAARGSLNDIDRAMAAMTQMPAAYDAAVARLASVASGAATIFARG